MLRSVVLAAAVFSVHAAPCSTQNPKHFVFVRHGQSVNNVLSADRDVLAYMSEVSRGAQDVVLSLLGRAQAFTVRSKLFPETQEGQATDPLGIFKPAPADANKPFSGFDGVYLSPMRRTQMTALSLFGKIAAAKNVPFKAIPWAHEQRKSKSDVGLPKAQLVAFAKEQPWCQDKYTGFSASVNEQLNSMDSVLPEDEEPIASLIASINNEIVCPSGDWGADITCPTEEFPYYPKNGMMGTKKESQTQMCKRMQKLEEALCQGDFDKAFVVCHSAVMRHTFSRFISGRKPENLLMIAATLTDEGWADVHVYGKPTLSGKELDPPGVGATMVEPSWMGPPDSKKQMPGRIDAKAVCQFQIAAKSRQFLGPLDKYNTNENTPWKHWSITPSFVGGNSIKTRFLGFFPGGIIYSDSKDMSAKAKGEIPVTEHTRIYWTSDEAKISELGAPWEGDGAFAHAGAPLGAVDMALEGVDKQARGKWKRWRDDPGCGDFDNTQQVPAFVDGKNMPRHLVLANDVAADLDIGASYSVVTFAASSAEQRETAWKLAYLAGCGGEDDGSDDNGSDDDGSDEIEMTKEEEMSDVVAVADKLRASLAHGEEDTEEVDDLEPDKEVELTEEEEERVENFRKASSDIDRVKKIGKIGSRFLQKNLSGKERKNRVRKSAKADATKDAAEDARADAAAGTLAPADRNLRHQQ